MAPSRSNVISLSTGAALSAEELAPRLAVAPLEREPLPQEARDRLTVESWLMALEHLLEAPRLSPDFEAALRERQRDLTAALAAGDAASLAAAAARQQRWQAEIRGR